MIQGGSQGQIWQPGSESSPQLSAQINREDRRLQWVISAIVCVLEQPCVHMCLCESLVLIKCIAVYYSTNSEHKSAASHLRVRVSETQRLHQNNTQSGRATKTTFRKRAWTNRAVCSSANNLMLCSSLYGGPKTQCKLKEKVDFMKKSQHLKNESTLKSSQYFKKYF